MTVTTEKPAPYAPAATIMGIIRRYRDRGMQTPFTKDVLARSGVSDSLIPRTLQALEILDLIDEDGNPTQTLEALRVAGESDFKARLAEWLRETYQEVFSFVDPSTDDTSAIRDAFRSYTPIGQQTRMVTLFTGLCAEAGLMPAKPEKEQSVRRTKYPNRGKAKKKAASPRLSKGGRSRSSQGIPSALAGLLDSLPNEGEGWTANRRDRFIRTFESVLDFCYPVVEEEETETDNEETEVS